MLSHAELLARETVIHTNGENVQRHCCCFTVREGEERRELMKDERWREREDEEGKQIKYRRV